MSLAPIVMCFSTKQFVDISCDRAHKSTVLEFRTFISLNIFLPLKITPSAKFKICPKGQGIKSQKQLAVERKRLKVDHWGTWMSHIGVSFTV